MKLCSYCYFYIHSYKLHAALFYNPVSCNDIGGSYTCQAFNHNDSLSESKTKLIVQCMGTVISWLSTSISFIIVSVDSPVVPIAISKITFHNLHGLYSCEKIFLKSQNKMDP